jgi:hypothetical protein
MSFKKSNVQYIALTTGSTVILGNGSIPIPPAFGSIDTCTEYAIVGTQTLAANFIVTMPSPADNAVVDIYWRARATHGAFTVTILGETIPSDMLLRDFTMKFIALGGSFSVLETNLDLTKGGQLPADRLVNASVGTAQMTDASVTYAKMQNVGGDSMLFRNSASAGVLSELAIAAQSVIGRIAGRIVNITASVNGHVLKMTGGNIGFAQLNFNELAGTLANAQVPDREIALAKMNSTGLLASQVSDTGTTAVTSEEVLFSYTIPAGLIANTGEGVRIKVSGTTAANGHTKTIRIKVGGNTYAINGVTTSPSGKNWFAQAEVYRAGATAAVGEGSLVVDNANEGVTIDSTGITWANTNDVQVTGQNGTATVNDIVVKTVSVTLIR